MNSGFSTNVGIFFLKIIAKFPFWFIYFLSDCFYLIVYYIVGYRKDVVFQNLKNSFPEKSDNELREISKKFFHHFSDITMETIKAISMKEKDFRERYIVKDIDKINKYYEQGKSVVVLTMHYNNWEWGSCFPLYNKHTGLAVYKPLHNAQFDIFMNKTRSVFGAELTPNSNVLRRVLMAKKQNEPVSIWLAGDQTPPVFHDFWITFLNQEAMFYPGPAFISKRFNYPVFFQNTQKTSRGKYEVSFDLLFENPEEYSEVEIIKFYIQKMEEVIRKKPEFYLWSHKRWKHKRPVDIELQD